MKPILIFDLDGTLIDSAPSILSCFALALDEEGFTPRVPLTSAIIGPPLMETLAILSGTNQPETLARLAAAFKRHYDVTGYQQSVVFPGVSETLHALVAEGAQIHIATNKRLFPTEKILAFLQWDKLFTTVYALDLPQYRFKTKAEMLAQQLLDIAPQAPVYYVGDRQEDRESAEKNHLPFLAACWGYGGFADAPPSDLPLAATQPEQLLSWWQAL